MSLFRKTALDALSSPEQLNQPLQLLRPSQWILLISLGVFSLTIVIWSIMGRIPVRISGRGVLIKPNSLAVVQSETTGRITQLPAEVGDCLKQGALMGRLAPVSQEVEMKAAQAKLAQMLLQDQSQDGLSAVRVRQLQSQINRITPLVRTGGVSLDDLSELQRELSELTYSIEAENSQREQQIKEQQSRIESRQEEITRTSLIRAPITGCVIDRVVHNGEVVQTGKTLFTMQAAEDRGRLESVAFFPAKDGKRLRQGQPVRISPTTTKQQRHGGIEGEILSIRPLPVRDEAVVKRLGFKSLLESVRAKPKEPLIEVTTSLEQDPQTPSGYDWGGGTGPVLELSAGTPTKVRVLVEERRPISYVIPILRDLTGIY